MITGDDLFWALLVLGFIWITMQVIVFKVTKNFAASLAIASMLYIGGVVIIIGITT